MKTTNHTRRGMTSVLAMLYLVLFSTLAIGFYAATNTQSQIVSNDERVAKASMASESGMDFMRYQLGRVNIPPSTPTDQVVNQLFADLQTQLEDTGNLGAQTISLSGNTISIPSGSGYINLDANGHSKFRATITDWAGEIVVKIAGQNGTQSASRAITMDFTRATNPTTAFNYAVASKGQIQMRKGAVTTVTGVDPSVATMMSALKADPAIKVTGGTIGGDLSIIEDATVVVTGGTVGGESTPSVILSDHVSVVDEPEFPIIDTSLYLPYATNTYTGGRGTLRNIRIPANTNPTFTGNKTIEGILYIESPNEVLFRGDVSLKGFIVFENSNDSSMNELDFRGNVSQSPLPSDPIFDPLRATSGVAILGPTTAVSMSGSTDSNLRGNVIVGSFAFDGSADIQIDQGTLMTYDETASSAVFDGKTVRFTATGGNNIPTTGITYNQYYDPKPVTYQEVSR